MDKVAGSCIKKRRPRSRALDSAVLVSGQSLACRLWCDGCLGAWTRHWGAGLLSDVPLGQSLCPHHFYLVRAIGVVFLRRWANWRLRSWACAGRVGQGTRPGGLTGRRLAGGWAAWFDPLARRRGFTRLGDVWSEMETCGVLIPYWGQLLSERFQLCQKGQVCHLLSDFGDSAHSHFVLWQAQYMVSWVIGMGCSPHMEWRECCCAASGGSSAGAGPRASLASRAAIEGLGQASQKMLRV